MQEIKKFKDSFGYNEFLIETDEGKFRILFAGNLDLYWTCYKSEDINNDKQDFFITKENYFLYSLFDKLYEDIKNNRIYYDITSDKYYECKNNELFKDGKIDWYSDEFYEEIASRLLIDKEDDRFKVTFIKSKMGYDYTFTTYSIRFRNSGSRYNPFNVCFMNMYNALGEYNSDYHQIHIEEYLYNKKKVLKKNI